MLPDKQSSWENEMDKVDAAGMVLDNLQAVRTSVAIAMPKAGGNAFRMMACRRAVNM